MRLNNLDSYTRISATLFHLGISLFVFCSLFLVLTHYWYPKPYFSASGGWQGLKIVALVDLVLGPLLTFCVFNKKKQKHLLVMDLSLIFAFQLSALCWGVYTVYQQHPAAIVFWEDRFYTVPYKALKNADPGLTQIAQLSDSKPPLIFAEKPKNHQELEQLLQNVKIKKLVPFHQSQIFRSIKPHLETIFDNEINIQEVINHNQEMKASLNALLEKLGLSIEQNIYIKLESRYRNIILVFDKSGKQLGYIEAPYKNEKYI